MDAADSADSITEGCITRISCHGAVAIGLEIRIRGHGSGCGLTIGGRAKTKESIQRPGRSIILVCLCGMHELRWCFNLIWDQDSAIDGTGTVEDRYVSLSTDFRVLCSVSGRPLVVLRLELWCSCSRAQIAFWVPLMALTPPTFRTQNQSFQSHTSVIDRPFTDMTHKYVRT